MFWNHPTLPEHSDLTDISVNSFRKTESELLKFIQDRKQIDFSKLPSEAELAAIYQTDPLIPCLDSILLGYRKKTTLLSDFLK